MPIVWFVLFFFIFAGFFQYDRCIAEEDSRTIVLRTSQMHRKDEASLVRSVLEKGELAGKKKLLFSDGVQRELNLTGGKAKIKINGRVNTILNSLIDEAEVPVFSYETEYEMRKYEPVSVIRMCRRIETYAGD